VSLQLLWMEFKQRCPEGHQYTQFVQHYRQWAGRLDVVLRQDHRAGEKLFLDFSGPTLPITDPETGVVTPAQLFVGVLGPATTPPSRPCPPRSCSSGSRPTSTCSSTWGERRRSWCRTTCAQG
jgi:transposase